MSSSNNNNNNNIRTLVSVQDVQWEDLCPHFLKPLSLAASSLNKSSSFLKKCCRHHGLKRWPYRKLNQFYNEFWGRQHYSTEAERLAIVELMIDYVNYIMEEPMDYIQEQILRYDLLGSVTSPSTSGNANPCSSLGVSGYRRAMEAPPLVINPSQNSAEPSPNPSNTSPNNSSSDHSVAVNSPNNLNGPNSSGWVQKTNVEDSNSEKEKNMSVPDRSSTLSVDSSSNDENQDERRNIEKDQTTSSRVSNSQTDMLRSVAIENLID